jgi:hypothetical protein
VNYVVVGDEDYLATASADLAAIDKIMAVDTVKPPPEIPSEIWQTARPDPEKCMAAVRAMCGARV